MWKVPTINPARDKKPKSTMLARCSDLRGSVSKTDTDGGVTHIEDNRDNVFATLGIDRYESSVAVYLPLFNADSFSPQVRSNTNKSPAQVMVSPSTCTRFAP